MTIQRYAGGVAVAGFLAAATAISLRGGPPEFGPAVAVLAALLVIGILVPLRYQHRGGIQGFTLDEAVVVTLLVVWDPGWVPALHVAAALTAHVSRRAGALKIVFNAGQVGLATSLAAVAFSLTGRGAPLFSVRGVTGIVLAVAVWNVVNSLVLSGLFRALEGRTVADYLRDVAAINVVTAVGNVSTGILLILVADSDWRGLLVANVLLLGLFLGYRGYISALGEGQRAEQLARLNQSLALVASGHEAFDRWLKDVGDLFAAGGVFLRLDSEAGYLDHVWGDVNLSSAAALAEGALSHGAGSEVRRLDGGEPNLVTSLVDSGRTVGALVLSGRRGLEPWDATDATILDAIASEAVVALRSTDLFRQVERERARWQEESAKLNDILSAASDGIATFTADGQIASWNPGMDALTGVDAAQAVERPWWTVLRVRDAEGEDLLPEGEHVVASALAGERHGDPVAVQVLRRDGQWRWVRATFSPLVSDEGNIDGTVMVARDVTAEHEVDELKADFVATVSHELRTPLTPLKGFLATLRQRGDMLTPHQISMLYSSMESQVGRLERLVNDLLVVADLDRGRVRLGHELVGLREAVEVARAEEQETTEDRVRIVGDRQLAAAADGNAVVRVVRALVSNALKHSDGPVTVELAREGVQVAVRVKDEGPGIPPWEQERIFKRFHRLGDHLHRTQGPGLGLSIAKALTDHLGGTLEVDSDVGRGATFTLRLRSAGPVPVASASTVDVG